MKQYEIKKDFITKDANGDDIFHYNVYYYNENNEVELIEFHSYDGKAMLDNQIKQGYKDKNQTEQIGTALQAVLTATPEEIEQIKKLLNII